MNYYLIFLPSSKAALLQGTLSRLEEPYLPSSLLPPFFPSLSELGWFLTVSMPATAVPSSPTIPFLCHPPEEGGGGCCARSLVAVSCCAAGSSWLAQVTSSPKPAPLLKSQRKQCGFTICVTGMGLFHGSCVPHAMAGGSSEEREYAQNKEMWSGSNYKISI